jgi:pyruvate dehydrogenase E1 component
MADPRLPFLAALECKALWLSSWMIHNANHLRAKEDGLKIGGHQASSASLATILTVLYGAALRPQDRVAVKPHASPIYHALHYLFGTQTLDKLRNFRGFKGAQSYPSRTKDVDDVDFSTGSVGLGVAQTLFSALVQDYVKAKGWGDWPEGRMVALVGDAEMDEGNIFEALLEGWKQGIRNVWWIVDYNRQSLDAVVREGLWERFESIFRNFGWDVVILKYGSLLEAAFKEPGGEALRRWIDTCPNQLYAALCYQGGAAWRKHLMDAIGSQGPAAKLIEGRSDDELARLMTNLAGHDMASLLEAFEEAAAHDRPTCFIAYTIKGHGLPFQGHKDNHAGLMTPAQMETWQKAMAIRPGHEWDQFEGLSVPAEEMRAFLDRVPFVQKGRRRLSAAQIPVPASLPYRASPQMSTQQGFGIILNDLAATALPVAERIVTTAPDVTVSTNLGGWVNRRGLFAREELADVFRKEKIPSTFTWDFSPKGQHIELGIAEMNLFILLSALGLSHSINGERLLPVGTLYDPFIQRGLDALNYACYQDARFMVVATPSGVTLAPEGGAHQSIATPLIGLAQDGLAAFEPAFVDELAVIMRFAFDYMQRNGEGDPDEMTWLRDETGGAVYLRLSTRTVDQPKRSMTPELATDIVNGAYWLRRPGANAEIVVAVTGAMAPEAIEAMGLMGEDRRDAGLLMITSADRLNAGWTAAERARQRGNAGAMSHIERLLAPLTRDCGLVTVVDGHPATLAWLGSVRGQRLTSLGVEHFGQTGTIQDLYRHHGIDANAILHAAQALSPGRPIRNRRDLPV